ncbi:MAG: hypothetical protein LC667_10610, partial [Thioalkalivibrio sp.]|nr:hypothetical protein [Thioalkalivibrio sp.]
DENPDVAAVGTYGWRVGEKGHVLGVFDVGPKSREHFESLRRSDQLIYLLAPSVMLRRDVALALGGFRHEPDGGEDVDFWSRVADDHVVLTLRERLVRYRVHGASMSTTKLFGALRNTERLRVNVGRRRRGEPELSSPEHLELLKAQPFRQRLRRNLQWRSRYAYRVAGGMLANRNPIGFAWLGASFLLYPTVPLMRLRQQIVPALRRPRRT